MSEVLDEKLKKSAVLWRKYELWRKQLKRSRVKWAVRHQQIGIPRFFRRVCKQGGVIMYAVIETGGKQYRVQEGDVLKVEKLPIEVGNTIEFDRILTVVNNGDVKIGRPVVEGAKVMAKVLEQDKSKKIIVFKYKAKSNYRRKQGHRQPFTRIVIEKIEA
jgi:large subunit ribosomal protein L21